MARQFKRISLAKALLATAAVLGVPAAAHAADSQPVKPYYGNLRPFYGNLRPFYGNLRPFYGNLRPFWGNLRPFWGDTGAFYGDLKGFWGATNPVVGAGAPDYLKVGDFWQSTGDAYQKTFDAWNAIPAGSAGTAYAGVASQLKGVIDASRDFWGASVKAKTGKNFDQGFANAVLAKYGINLDDPKSLDSLDPTDRAMFFLDWYDGLMNFSGTDHVDHWMKAVNWTPALAKVQGPGGDVTVGILDQTFVGDAALAGSVIRSDGVSTFTNGHGAAVASLIVGAHDGQGVMGMAPSAKVIAYNPFDDTGTASWADVTKGVQMLKASGASVVNMSLGVPGSTFDPGWNNVFSNLSTTLILKNTIFVVAAGNDGVTQTKNVNWFPLNPNLIIVGSVDVDGNISNFSNRPGNACLATLGLLCLPGGYLKDHFIVAPGEMILVDDGNGGVTRQIGTSFAAPLVSGAIALLHERWPWLANYPAETANIILSSAKDLGAPGVDPVYGHGLLDVAASQAPLNFNSLTFYTVSNGKIAGAISQSSAIAAYKAEQTKTWDAQGAYFYAFEPLGLLTQRDFAIPLSQKLVGQTVTTYNGAQEQFSAYLLNRMGAWAAGTGHLASAPGAPSTALYGLASQRTKVANPWGADMTVAFAPRAQHFGYVDQGPAYQSNVRIETERTAFTAGFGDGAPALAQASGFTQAADFDAEKGGANPLLGLASGGGYASLSYGLTSRLSISAGALQRDEMRDRRLLPALGLRGNGAERYDADAQHVSLAWTAAPGLTLSTSYTRLHEGSALLGVQSFDPTDLSHGSTTDGWSLAAAWEAAPKLQLMAAGTVGRTRSTGADQTLKVGKDGLTTSSYELGLMSRDLFAKGDRLQFTLSQPMHVEHGKIDLQTVQVVDRETGEIGIVTQSFDVTAKRKLAGEALYVTPLAAGQGDVALFGRVETEDMGRTAQSYIAGGRYRISF